MNYRRLRAKYQENVLKPERPLDLPEGAEVTVVILPAFRSFCGILAEVKADSVTLQHQVKEHWGPDVN